MKEKIFTTFFFKIASAGFSFIVVILLSQILGAAGKGEASIILTTLSIILIFSEFTGGGSLIYLVPRGNVKSLLLTSYVWALGVSALSYFIISFYSIVHSVYAYHIVIIAFIVSIGGANSKVLIARERLGKSNFLQFLQVFIIFFVLVFNFYFLNHKSIGVYISALYISSFIITVLSFIFIRNDFQIEKGQKLLFLFKETLFYGTKNQTAHITQMLSFRISYYILERFWGLGLVGIYSNAVSIAESIWLISKSVAVVQISRITNVQNERYNRLLTITLTKQTIFLTFFFLILLLCLPGSSYAFLFGAEFSELPGIILSLAPGIIFFSIALIVGYYFSGKGKYEINALASSVGFLVTLVLGFILIPFYSMWGAGITASVSYLVTAGIVLNVFFKKRVKSWISILPGQKDLLILWNEMKRILTIYK